MEQRQTDKSGYYDMASVYSGLSENGFQVYLESDKERFQLDVERNFNIGKYSREERLKYKTLMSYRLAGALNTIVFQALAVETYINWYCYTIFGREEFYVAERKKRQSTIYKFKKILRHYKIGVEAFGQYDILQKLFEKRDQLVHYKPTGLDDNELDIGEILQHYQQQIGFIYENISEIAGIYDILTKFISIIDGTGITLSEEETKRQQDVLGPL